MLFIQLNRQCRLIFTVKHQPVKGHLLSRQEGRCITRLLFGEELNILRHNLIIEDTRISGWGRWRWCGLLSRQFFLFSRYSFRGWLRLDQQLHPIIAYSNRHIRIEDHG